MGRLNETSKGNSNILYLEDNAKEKVRLLFDGMNKLVMPQASRMDK